MLKRIMGAAMDLDRQIKAYATGQLHGLDYNIMPVWKGKKNPFFKEWKIRQEKRLTRVELHSVFTRHDVDPAIICGELEETKVNVIGFDFDSPEEFERWSGPAFNQVAATTDGFHGYAQLPLGVRIPNSVKLEGRPLDIRHYGAYLKCPPGVSDSGFVYRWIKGPVRANELVMMDPAMLIKTKETTTVNVDKIVTGTMGKTMEIVGMMTTSNIKNPKAYAMKLDSIQGQGGSKKLVRFLKILRDGGIPSDEAWQLLLTWNASGKCQPPWSEGELLHAFRRHFLGEVANV